MIFTSAGQRLDKDALPLTPVDDDPVFTVDADLYVGIAYPRVEGRPGLALFRRAGQTVKQSEIDRAFDDATVVTVAPASGPTAGGTVVTIAGTHLDGATGVTFGGVAGTAFTVVSPTEVTVTTPAGVAGPVDVLVLDDSGDVALVGGFTYIAPPPV